MPPAPLIRSLAFLAIAGCAPAWSQTPLFDSGRTATLEEARGAFSCPTDRLVNLYAALGQDEVLGIMAVETEVLLICSERQEKLLRIAEAELRLRKALNIAEPGPGAARISITGADLAAGAAQVTDCPAPGTTAGSPVQTPAHGGGGNGADPDAEALAEASAVSGAGVPAPLTAEPAAGPSGRTGGAAEAVASVRGLLELALAASAPLALTPAAAEGGQSCGGWSWVWTTRDFSGGRTALLRSEDGAEIEIGEQDSLPGGLTVASISNAGVSLSEPGGGTIRLPPVSQGGAPAAAAGGREEESPGSMSGVPADIQSRAIEILGEGG